MLEIIATVRRKLLGERLLRGLAVVLLATILVSVLLSYVLARHNFSEPALFWTRLLGGLLLVLLLAGGLLAPLLRRRYSPGRLARFLEERNPQLEQGLSTVVEIREGQAPADPELRRLLERDVRRKLIHVPLPRFYDPRGSLLSLLTGTVSVFLFAYLFFGGPEAYRYSLDRLFWSWYADGTLPLYSIQVTPGSTTVAKHADVEVRAVLAGFESRRVSLLVRYGEDPSWEEVRMRPDPESGGFVFLFFDVRDPMDYYVEADGIRSETYSLQVSEIPRVSALELRLVFPRYTRLDPAVQKDEGDIEALVGTTAHFRIESDQPIRGALLKLEEGGSIGLEEDGAGGYRGSIKIRRSDYYRIHLQNQEEVWNPGTNEYVILAVEDQPPRIVFKQPGRDRRVSNIEEVFMELQAGDDHGIRSLSLRYSVNGEAEQAIELTPVAGAGSFTVGHTFFLEEHDLVPGDFVSYHARASDAVSHSDTDIFFLEVQPYDREYYQSQTGGIGLPGGGSQELELSKRQKQIIIATFKLQKDRTSTPAEEFKEQSQTAALVQQRLREEVQVIADRLERRQAAASDERFRKMRERLSEAMTHMEPAHDRLNQVEPEQALPHEQKAFRQLLSAESLFKEIQVSFGESQGAGGAASEELADLVDLELDRTKNQYETIRQNQQFRQEQQLDEALEKLKELARRQEQAVERSRRMAGRGSGADRLTAQQLREEIQRLTRQLERLSRQEQQRELSQVSNRLREAARDLGQGGNGQMGERQRMLAERALQRLKEAQEALEKTRQEQISERIRQLSQDSRRMLHRQERTLDEMDGVGERLKQGKVDRETIRQIRNLLREKGELQQELSRVEGELHQTAKRTAAQEPQASRRLKQAGNKIRDDRLSEKMQEGSELLSRGWVDLAQDREDGVTQGLQELVENIDEAAQALGQKGPPGAEEGLKQAGEEVAELVEGLESLRRRLSQGGADGKEGSEGEEGSGEGSGEMTGNEGSQGEGDRGSRPQGQPGDSRQAGSRANLSGIDPRQLRREWQERLQDAESISRLLRGEHSLGRDAAALSREMRELALERIFSDPEEIARLKSKIVHGFQQLELEISRALDREEENLVWLFQEEEVPPVFRERVEEYYRTLSSERGSR